MMGIELRDIVVDVHVCLLGERDVSCPSLYEYSQK